MAYFGSTEDVVDHFDSVGVTMEENYNPADFMCKLNWRCYVKFLLEILCVT